jgi:hypothetical protein
MVKAVVGRVEAVWGLAVALVLALSVPVHADTWYAQMERSAQSPSYCPDIPLVFEMTTQGAQFSGKLRTAGGDYAFSSPIGGGGEVSANFTMKGMGTATVSGNATTKALQLTGNSTRNCVFLLKPTTVGPGAIKQWKATMQQTSGNVQTCKSGARGSVTMIGDALFFFEVSWIGPIFGVKVKPDGSADVDTMTAYGRSARARVKVAPGTGPRELSFVTYSNVCGYKVIPD